MGKTRTVMAARAFITELPDFHIAPTSVTGASLVDALVEAKRMIVQLPNPAMEYNSMTIVADELGAFMHKFDDEIIGILTTFYDVTVPYAQQRRGKDLKIKIRHPQLNILSGTTPSNLMKFMPENAWDQGFTSRVIMVFSDERIIGDIWEQEKRGIPEEMMHDLRLINSLAGQFRVDEEYKVAINNWRRLGQPDVPNHPKLTHYNTRRLAHLFKLSMVAAVDKGNTLLLDKACFNTALGWLLEAELAMPDIFKAGSVSADSKVMDEIWHYITARANSRCTEHNLVTYARELVPAHAVMRVVEVMEKSGMIKAVAIDKTGNRIYQAMAKD